MMEKANKFIFLTNIFKLKLNKMKKTKILFVFLLLMDFVLTPVSCTKDNNKDLTPREILTSHGWKISKVVQYNTDTASETTYSVKNCELDDCQIFKPDGTGKAILGSVKCDPNETAETFTWNMSEDGKSLTISPSSLPSTIVSISKTSMILKLESFLGLRWTFTYVPC